jgi:cell division septum initiation protein DivIVA
MSPEPPIDATGIARRQFSTARKGFDTREVRAFLTEVSDLVGRLQREQAHEHERAERAESRADLAEQLDEHRLVELLGEETARVLDAARAAGADIRAKAEESAARMVRDAQAEARSIMEQADRDAAGRKVEILAEVDALRREAEAEVDRRRAEGRTIADDIRREAEDERDHMLAEGERARAEAESAAETIRASAREQGRRLVGEAQAVRERMLGDLSRRRRVAREQLERLNGARERLLAAYEVVKRTVDEATAELTVALPEAKAASEMAMRRVSESQDDSVEVIEAELSVARMSGLDDEVAGAAVTDDELDAMIRDLAEEEAAQAAEAAAAEEAAAEAGAVSGSDGSPDGVTTEALDDAARGTAVAAGGELPAQGGPGTGAPADASAPADTSPRASAAAGDPEAGLPPTGATPSGAGARGPTASGVSDANRVAAAPTAAPSPVAKADRPAGEQTDAEKWGVRLPRSRRRSSSRAAPAPATESADVTTAPAPAPANATAAPAAESAGDTGADAEPMDDLFARIRAERTAAPAAESPATGPVASTDRNNLGVAAAPAGVESSDVEASDADTADAGDEADVLDPTRRVLVTRDDMLAGVERDLGRRLKRVLADEQNEVLDMLRRGGTIEFDDVVPAADEHADRFAIVAMSDLDAAAAHGAALVDAVIAGTGSADPDVKPVPCDDLAGDLGRGLVEPLRARMRRSFDDCEGDLEEVSERLRALYREWKGQRIGSAVRHVTASAYARGAYEVAPAGAALQWLVDPSCRACPDCDDNALAGTVTKGDAFPTGDAFAPAHTDCRCLVVPTDVVEVG